MTAGTNLFGVLIDICSCNFLPADIVCGVISSAITVDLFVDHLWKITVLYICVCVFVVEPF